MCNVVLCVCAGGVQVPLLYLHEGWAVQSVEGELRHDGAGHALRRHPVLFPRAVQKTAGGPIWLPGQVSKVLIYEYVQVGLAMFATCDVLNMMVNFVFAQQLCQWFSKCVLGPNFGS